MTDRSSHLSSRAAAPRRRRVFVVIALVTLVAPLLVTGASPTASPPPGFYEGRVTPKDFLPLHAPQNTLRLPFWRSESNSTRLASILPEGQPVASGEVIATFQFSERAARQEISERVDRLRARRDDVLLGLRKDLVALEVRLEKARLRERLAALELGRKPTVSVRRQQLLDLDARLAAHERRALEHKLNAARDNLTCTAAVLEGNIRTWEGFFTVYDRTRERFTIRAPAPGTLFYPTMDKPRRKIAIGDEINSGAHFLSVVTSDRIGIQFTVPEADLPRVRVGTRVRVVVEGRELPATITDLGFFPVRFGEVKGTWAIPDAWEKCFLAVADLHGEIRLGSSSLVRVRLDSGERGDRTGDEEARAPGANGGDEAGERRPRSRIPMAAAAAPATPTAAMPATARPTSPASADTAVGDAMARPIAIATPSTPVPGNLPTGIGPNRGDGR